MVLYESPNARVEWLENEKIVFKKFKKFIFGDDLKKAFNAGYEAMKENKGIKWLTDNSELPVYKQEDMEWINKDWFPRMKKLGWKYWAVIQPQSATGQLAMRHFKFYQDEGIIVKYFENYNDALAWLKSVN